MTIAIDIDHDVLRRHPNGQGIFSDNSSMYEYKGHIPVNFISVKTLSAMIAGYYIMERAGTPWLLAVVRSVLHRPV